MKRKQVASDTCLKQAHAFQPKINPVSKLLATKSMIDTSRSVNDSVIETILSDIR
jgi:hypothetical protein